jgi:hypothetical protein
MALTENYNVDPGAVAIAGINCLVGAAHPA